MAEEKRINIEEQELIVAQLQDVVGVMCEVRTTTNHLYFSGRVKAYDDVALTLVGANGEALPSVIYNTECKLIIRIPGDRALLYRGKVRGSSRELWKVDQLSINSPTESRAYFRQPVSMDAEIVCTTPEQQQQRKEATRYPCRVEDISLEGAKISLCARLERRDEVLLTKLNLHPDGRNPFAFRIDICWADRIGPEKFLYGCRFISMPDGVQDALCAAIFALQRRDLQNRRRRE